MFSSFSCFLVFLFSTTHFRTQIDLFLLVTFPYVPSAVMHSHFGVITVHIRNNNMLLINIWEKPKSAAMKINVCMDGDDKIE